MKKLIIALMLVIMPAMVYAEEGGANLMSVNIDARDTSSLQNGAKLFVNYCMGCHSLKYLRYSRLGRDLGIAPDLVKKYLIFTGAKVHDEMTNAMRAKDAKKWFGVVPPDLTLEVRRRGADWVYTYLNSFYRDPSRPTGVNNVVFPKVGMPDVLANLQGVGEPVEKKVTEDGDTHTVITGVKDFKGGTLSQQVFKSDMRDLVNFLAYAAEPMKVERIDLGIKVIIFLLFFFAIAYLLKKEYWKDVH